MFLDLFKFTDYAADLRDYVMKESIFVFMLPIMVFIVFIGVLSMLNIVKNNKNKPNDSKIVKMFRGFMVIIAGVFGFVVCYMMDTSLSKDIYLNQDIKEEIIKIDEIKNEKIIYSNKNKFIIFESLYESEKIEENKEYIIRYYPNTKIIKTIKGVDKNVK